MAWFELGEPIPYFFWFGCDNGLRVFQLIGRFNIFTPLSTRMIMMTMMIIKNKYNNDEDDDEDEDDDDGDSKIGR